MSSKTSSPSSVKSLSNNNCSRSNNSQQDEWVEIIEPKSKTKIYANLQSGLCAKKPPEGVSVLKSEDFSDHWWELHDQKTGKNYYYNPEQQKTVWTKPSATAANGNGESKRGGLLIIPVSKLQNFKKYSSLEREKRDASTQTIASSLMSTGTQTISETAFETIDNREISDKIKAINLNADSDVATAAAALDNNKFTQKKPSSCTHSTDTTVTSPYKSYLNHRQLSDFTGRYRIPFLRSTTTKQPGISESRPLCDRGADQLDRSNSSQTGLAKSKFGPFRGIDSDAVGADHHSPSSELTSPGGASYFGPPSLYRKNRRSMHIGLSIDSQVPSEQLGRHQENNLHLQQHHHYNKPSVSTFKTAPLNSTKPSTIVVNQQQQRQDLVDKIGSKQKSPQQQMATNNLSHYLVKEARAMGIALISDDEFDDDDQDSDDECAGDEDDDTDMRDDLSSIRTGAASDLNASQELCEDSSWKSVSDRGSPQNNLSTAAVGRSQRNKTTTLSAHTSDDATSKSPILCETSTPSFTYKDLIDDQKNPAASLIQQLDNRKLVENFKKSRHSPSFGLHDSLGRSAKLDASNAVQKIKTVADSYFNIIDRDQQLSQKSLRQISALSTLPRPRKETKDKLLSVSSSVGQDEELGNVGVIDADYDVVEENCSFYSDSENAPLKGQLLSSGEQKKVEPSSDLKTSRDNHSPVGNFDRNKSTRGSTFSVESFARENLTRHPKGGLLFNRKVKWSRMIVWTKNSIKQPMVSSVSSDLNSESIASFKLIQQYMGDRKITMNKKYRQLLAQVGASGDELHGSGSTNRKSLGRSSSLNASSHNTSSSSSASGTGQTTNIPDSLRDELAFELTVKGCTKAALRDEIFVQMTRQLTENPSQESLGWGLVLMSILFNYFSPSAKFAPFLTSFLEAHPHPMARDVCMPRLEKRLRQNWLSYCRKPADGKEISIVRLSITKWPQYCGVFGESLEKIMSLQSCSPYLRTLRLPWILTTLGERLIETGGLETEGVFRCAADHDLIAQLRLEIDCVDFRKITDAKQVRALLSNVQDPHAVAGLLKLFFRQLYEPIFPSQLYEICLQNGQDGQMACRLFNERLPNLNKDVVAYLIRLLQRLSEPDNVSQTKMDTSNLSMVWAPNLLRLVEQPAEQLASSFDCGGGNSSRSGSKWSIANTSNNDQQPQQHDPTQIVSTTATATTTPSQSMIFEQTRQEMQFIRMLILHLDTSFIKDIL